MKAKTSRFDSLVARYYPAVYSFASRLTDNPREAVALTRYTFKNKQKKIGTVTMRQRLRPFSYLL
jgi:DNA-directed RNA polymerase specialized sigma24 family protein